jgi:hypothetical protein
MQHPDFKGRVQDEFAARGYASRDVKSHISLRCKVAQDLLAEETQDIKNIVKEGANEEYKQLLAEHKEAMEGTPSVRVEDQAL